MEGEGIRRHGCDLYEDLKRMIAEVCGTVMKLSISTFPEVGGSIE